MMETNSLTSGVKVVTLTLTSTSFIQNGIIPIRYTCDGQDISPPLFWTGVPNSTKSLVLIVDDPDAPDPAAPKMIWVHWLLYNIPPESNSLSDGIAPESLPFGTLRGINDWGSLDYGGPRPPVGNHRYFHKLYAIDIVLPDLMNPVKNELERAMLGHIISYTELIGHYQRPQ